MPNQNEKEEKNLDLENETTKEVEKIEDVLTDENDEVLEETIEITSIDTLEDKEEIKDKEIEAKEEPKETNTNDEQNNNTEKVNKKKTSNKRNIIAIVLICLILILFVLLIMVFNKSNDKKDKDEPVNDSPDVVVTEEDKKNIVKSYGESLEKVVADSYQSNQKVLTYEEANKLLELEDDVNCNIHEIYEDGKVYLTDCYVNGKRVEYGYGTKQEPKEQFDPKTMIKVFVNKTTNERTLITPNDTSLYDEYIVHVGKEFNEPTLLSYEDYVFYYDSEYNVQMKNFKTDKKVLEGIKYKSVLPIKQEFGLYDNKYIALNNGNKWGIYNLETSKAVIACMYDAVAVHLLGSTSGPPLEINALKGSNIAVVKGHKYGVIDYKTGKEIIPIQNDYLFKSGNYLWASYDDRTKNAIYDFSGNKYFTEGYDRVLGISEGTYVLVQKDDSVKIIQVDGKVLYDFGEVEELGDSGFFTGGNGRHTFQVEKKDEAGKCVEYTYDQNEKTGTTKVVNCY